MDLKAELESLKRKNAELEVRVQELTATCDGLKCLCAAHNVPSEDILAAGQHPWPSAQTYGDHPTEDATVASEVLALVPIGHLVAEMLPALSSFSQASRCILSVLQQLPVNCRWRMGKVRCVLNLTAHGSGVRALAQLDGGLMASGSDTYPARPALKV